MKRQALHFSSFYLYFVITNESFIVYFSLHLFMRPTAIILFGITGDLVQKKLLQAMYDLYIHGKLQNAKIVGFSRREFGEDELREFVKKTISAPVFEGKIDETFLDKLSYVQGQFDDLASYEKLKGYLEKTCDEDFGVCSDKLFYLSVPPHLYETICIHLAKSGL